MKRSARKKAAMVISGLLFAVFAFQASAAELTIVSPKHAGYRLDLCLHWGMQCAGEAADAYCKFLGFDRVTEWEPELDVGAQSPTIVMGDNRVCDGAYCDSFAWISCVREDGWTQSTGYGGLYVKLEWEPASDSLAGALVIAVNVDNPETAAAALLTEDRTAFLHTPPGNYIVFIEDFKNISSVGNTLRAGMRVEISKDGYYLAWSMDQWSK